MCIEYFVVLFVWCLELGLGWVGFGYGEVRWCDEDVDEDDEDVNEDGECVWDGM